MGTRLMPGDPRCRASPPTLRSGHVLAMSDNVCNSYNTAEGTPCQNPIGPGSVRCHLHGGSPSTTPSPRSHGPKSNAALLAGTISIDDALILDEVLPGFPEDGWRFEQTFINSGEIGDMSPRRQENEWVGDDYTNYYVRTIGTDTRWAIAYAVGVVEGEQECFQCEGQGSDALGEDCSDCSGAGSRTQYWCEEIQHSWCEARSGDEWVPEDPTEEYDYDLPGSYHTWNTEAEARDEARTFLERDKVLTMEALGAPASV